MVRRAVLCTPENSIPTAHLLFSSLQRSAASGSQKDGAGNMAVNQSAKSSPEHSANARARVRDTAQRSIARSEGSAVATFHRWRKSAVVMSKGIGRSSGRAPRRFQSLADAFAKVLAQPVRTEAVPRDRWESIFRAQGMKNPTPRMQMIDGFNAGWIDFPNRGANARKGCIGIDQAIATLIQRELT